MTFRTEELMRRLNNFGLGTVSAVVLMAAAPAWSAAQSDQGQGAGCFPAEHDQSKMILAKVRKAVSDPKLDVIRQPMGLELIPADSVVLITDPGKCNVARVRIDSFRGELPSQRRLVLVRVGNKYWAEDPVLRGGEFNDMYILDSELKGVISRH